MKLAPTIARSLVCVLLLLACCSSTSAQKTRRRAAPRRASPRRTTPPPRFRFRYPPWWKRNVPQPAVPADPSDVWTWQPFRSEPGRFTVSLPGTPELMIREVETPLGTVTNHIHTLDTPVALFVVLYGDVPGVPNVVPTRQAETMLDGGRDQVLADGTGRRLVRETSVRVGGHPARDLLIASDEIPLTQMRIVVANNRTYQLMIATGDHRRSSEEDKLFYERITRRFLDSFTTDIGHEPGDGITARRSTNAEQSSETGGGR